MSDAFSALFGAIVGGGCSLLGTYLTLRFYSKTEIKKLSLSFLMKKKSLMESLKDRCSVFNYSGNIEEDEGIVFDEYKVISEFIYKKSHYFTESEEFRKIQNSLSDIENTQGNSPSDQAYLENSFNIEFHTFIGKELEATMAQIFRELRN